MKQNDDLKRFFEEAKQRAQELERDKVSGASVERGQEQVVRDRLYQMIQYAVGRHDWYDNQRHRFLQIGLALMAAGVTACAIFVKLAERLSEVTEILSWVFGIVIFATGLYLVYLYNKGVARNHPYRKIADIRSWYFAYTFPSGLSDHLSSKSDVAKREVNEVIDGVASFFDRWLELNKDRLAFLKEDLEQVFILQLLQRYRSQQVKKMSSALYKGLSVAFLFLLLVFGSFLYFDVTSTRAPVGGLSSDQVDSSQISSDAETMGATSEHTPDQHLSPNSDPGAREPSGIREPEQSNHGVVDTSGFSQDGG